MIGHRYLDGGRRAFLLLLVAVAPTIAAGSPTILFFGDSITAGYRLTRQLAFPAVVQAKIDSVGWQGTVINAGLSGETSAGGRRRLDWVLGAHERVDIFVLELGGNDGLRGVPLASTAANLDSILKRVQLKFPKSELVLATVKMPPNLGPDYAASFASIYPQLARDHDATLIPFLLEGVATIRELNIDDIHPNREGHRLVGATVWSYLEPLIRDLQPSAPQGTESIGSAQHLEGRSGVDTTAAGDADQDGSQGYDGDDGR